MTELGEIFAELGISHYLHDFVEQGFDTWDTILDITESDFDALNVKLGHRRKIQRKIAQSRGLSSDRALASPSRNTPTDDRPIDETKGGGHRADANTSSGGTQGAKRKYRRHPKPDENAPERPPSAYVIFSNKMREDLKGKPLSFTEIAKLVGENWQNLAPHEREPFEQQAFTAKEKYNAELVEYKKTEQYKEYSQYLVDFKARQSHQQQADVEVTKRPKLEPQVSTASTGTTSSGASIHGSEPPSGRKRDDSAATNGSWSAGTRQLSPTSQSPTLTNMSGVQAGAQLSPNPTSPTILPGYRDSVVYGATLQARPPARREAKQRDETVIPMHQLPRLSDPSDMRMSFDRHNINNNRGDSLNMTGALQHAHRTGQGQPPPLLTSESTSGTTRSSGSSASTTSYLPRTPMEPSVDRSLPIPNMYSQKPYELPPLRPPSLSPQNSILNPQQSPHNIPSYTDFPSTMAPMRGHTAINSRQQRPFPSANTIDDTVLDPVSALIKAGEIVDRNSRPRPPS